MADRKLRDPCLSQSTLDTSRSNHPGHNHKLRTCNFLSFPAYYECLSLDVLNSKKLNNLAMGKAAVVHTRLFRLCCCSKDFEAQHSSSIIALVNRKRTCTVAVHQLTLRNCLQLRIAKRHVDDLSNLQQQGVDARVRSLQGIDRQPQARGNDEEGLPRHDGVGGVAALDAVVVVRGLGEARRVVRAARECGHLEHLVQIEEARVGEAVELGDVADARAQLLRDDGQGVAGRHGVLDRGARAAGDRRRGARAGACGRGARRGGLRAIGLLMMS